MMKLSILIQAKEAVVAPVRRIRSAIRSMVTMGVRDVARLDRMMERLRKTAYNVGTTIGRTVRNGVIAAGAAVGGLIAAVLGTASSFEQFQVVLEGTEGSAAKARKAMAWVQNFAKRTPYELNEVMSAFVQLRAYGIDPTQGALESLGDASAGMKKDLMAAVEMLADAQTGEFERLKEFGVRAKVAGAQVSFTYMMAGKEITKTVKNSSDDIQKAITGIFDDRFAGQMKRQSGTMKGLWSNLMDMMSAGMMQVANAGFFDFVKGQLQQLLNWVNRLAANGQLAAWAKRVSDGLVSIGKELVGVDWIGFAQSAIGLIKVLTAIGKGILWLVGGVRGLVDLGVAAIITRIGFAFYGLATALGVVAIAGAPIWVVIGVVGVLAFAAYKIITNWSKVAAFFGRMWTNIKAAFAAGVSALWNMLPAWFRGVLTGATFAVKTIASAIVGEPGGRAGGGPRRPAPYPAPNGAGPRLGPPVATRRGFASPGFGKTEVGGRLDIRVQTDAGATAKVTRLQSANSDVPIDVTRGRVAFG